MTSGTTGEGSHLTENRDTLGTRNPGSQNTTLTALGRNQNNEISSGTAEAQDTGLTNQTDLRTDPDLDGSRNTGGVVSKISEGYGTNTSGAFPDDPTRNTTSAGSELAASDTVGKNPAMDTNLGSSTAKVTSSGAGHGTSNTSEGNTGFGGVNLLEKFNLGSKLIDMHYSRTSPKPRTASIHLLTQAAKLVSSPLTITHEHTVVELRRLIAIIIPFRDVTLLSEEGMPD